MDFAKPDRRALLLTCGAIFASAHVPRMAYAAGARDPRLITIILRGAVDGLSVAAPVGDPDYAGLRGAIALAKSGENAAIPLDAFFGLHPAMPVFARLYREGKASVVHAVATSYRERSHFDGQDVLESGFAGPGQVQSGWLNRVIAALPKGERTRPGGLGIGASTPLILRGAAPVTGWAPTALPRAADDLAMRLMDLYTHRDPALANALSQGLDTEKIAAREKGATGQGGGVNAMRTIAKGTARLVASDDGPRIAALAFDGWDTHANEGGATGRLAQLLAGLDGALEEFERGLGAHWAKTTIVVITEFGRTAKINGTTGTDHGTGTVALLAGGAVKGGRVIADWPGLAQAQLHGGRDLKPTMDLRAVLKGILSQKFGLSDSVLARDIFPDSQGVKPFADLLRV